jgi:hypothetical protein
LIFTHHQIVTLLLTFLDSCLLASPAAYGACSIWLYHRQLQEACLRNVLMLSCCYDNVMFAALTGEEAESALVAAVGRIAASSSFGPLLPQMLAGSMAELFPAEDWTWTSNR